MYFALIGNFGTWEILLILFVALMVFGPGKLPEVAKTIGKTMGEIRRYTSGVQKEFQDAINLDAETSTKKATLSSHADGPVVETGIVEEATEEPTAESAEVIAEHAADIDDTAGTTVLAEEKQMIREY